MYSVRTRETKGTPILYIVRMSSGIEMLYHCSGPNANIPYIEKIRNDRNLLNGFVNVNFNIAYSTFNCNSVN